MSANTILDNVAFTFIESARSDWFNGVPAKALLSLQSNEEKLRGFLKELIEQHRITAVFECMQVNMHIKRLPDLPLDQQLHLLQSEDLGGFCLYPTASEIQERTDMSQWQDRPFSKVLALAEPQLAYRAFEMGALERYTADPRYVVHFADYMGDMSITDTYFSDGQHPERDKVSLQTFGLGFDEQYIPYTVVFFALPCWAVTRTPAILVQLFDGCRCLYV